MCGVTMCAGDMTMSAGGEMTSADVDRDDACLVNQKVRKLDK